MRSSRLAATAIAIGIGLLAAAPSHAEDYIYTGNAFNILGSRGLSAGAYISADLTFNAPLTDNFESDLPSPQTLTAWSITDGVNTVNSTDGTYDFVALRISGGSIVSWEVNIADGTDDLGTFAGSTYGADGICIGGSCDFSESLTVDNGGPAAGNNLQAGTWAEVSSTPEPSSMALGFLSLSLPLAAFWRRRVRR